MKSCRYKRYSKNENRRGKMDIHMLTFETTK